MYYGILKKAVKTLIVLLLACTNAAVSASEFEFTLHKKGLEHERPVLLVIGGIQGDEPGGFNAASLLVTQYGISKGQVWIVPNLNFESIIKRSRGVYGDMNRKFPEPKSKDPDYSRVQRIKNIITDQQVNYVLNLHDGSGFYRPKYISKQFSPRRWGQSVIIDQEVVEGIEFGELQATAERALSIVNQNLTQRAHKYHIKNTKTRFGNREMARTLTYFAINNGKAAIGIEASKSLNTHHRAYYHLHVVEAYMKILGIKFERRFNLMPVNVKKAIENDIRLTFFDNRVAYDVSDARKTIRYVPLKKNTRLEYISTNPLVAVMESGKKFKVRYGNRSVTHLEPEFFNYDASLEGIDIDIDGNVKHVALGGEFIVRNFFEVLAEDEYRVNVIGFKHPRGMRNENKVRVKKNKIAKRFSVDNNARIFRVEIYKGKKFCGMVLARIGDSPTGKNAQHKETL